MQEEDTLDHCVHFSQLVDVSHKHPPLCVVVRVKAHSSHELEQLPFNLGYDTQHPNHRNSTHTILMKKGTKLQAFRNILLPCE